MIKTTSKESENAMRDLFGTNYGVPEFSKEHEEISKMTTAITKAQRKQEEDDRETRMISRRLSDSLIGDSSIVDAIREVPYEAVKKRLGQMGEINMQNRLKAVELVLGDEAGVEEIEPLLNKNHRNIIKVLDNVSVPAKVAIIKTFPLD